jgi:hypothetical protein
MDFSDRIPNISAVHRKIGGSYDKIYRQIHGTMPVTREARARAIEDATDGLIGWEEILVKPGQKDAA